MKVPVRSHRFFTLAEEEHFNDNFSCADADAAVLNFLRQLGQVLSVPQFGGWVIVSGSRAGSQK